MFKNYWAVCLGVFLFVFLGKAACTREKCKDRNAGCLQYASFCHSEDETFRKVMKNFCPKTCGYCKTHPCAKKPCKHDGVCVRTDDSFKCQCTQGFTGQFCDKKIDPCDRKPCRHGGKCYNMSYKKFKCKCQEGYAGSRCEKKTHPCIKMPCKNNGVCVTAEDNNFKCQCLHGFTGHFCEKVEDSCKDFSPNCVMFHKGHPFCIYNPRAMMCKKTCGLCHAEDLCQDMFGGCRKFHKGHPFCVNYSAAVMCRKSCGFCHVEGEKKQKHEKEGNSCRDKSQRCTMFHKGHPFCIYDHRAIMCKKTCRLCHESTKHANYYTKHKYQPAVMWTKPQ